MWAETIVRELKKRGIDVYVVAGSPGKSKEEKFDGILIQRVNLFPTRYSFNIKGIFALDKAVKKFKPDVIHASVYNSAIPASIVGMKHKIPVVISLHNIFLGEWFNYYNPLIAAFGYVFERILFKFPYDRIMALDWCGVKNCGKIGLKKNVVLIPHPIDTDFYKLKKRKKKDKLVIGTAITATKAKRNDIFFSLAKSMRNNPKVRFQAFGRYGRDIERQIIDAGIKPLGTLPDSKMADAFNDLDVYIGQGMAAKEAMACGCVTLLNQGTRRLRLYHKPELEAGAMLQGNHRKIIEDLISSRKKREKIGLKASEFIRKNYSKDKVMDQIIKLYRDMNR